MARPGACSNVTATRTSARRAPFTMTEHAMFTTLILATALAIAAITIQPQASAPTPPAANPLTLPWTGPYGGVPPWDAAKPELFPAAFEAAIAGQRAEIDAIAAGAGPATF